MIPSLPQDLANEQASIDDALFRERYVETGRWTEYGTLFVESLIPILVFFPVARIEWLIAWEALWLVSVAARLTMRYQYGKRFPRPSRPPLPRRWTVYRHIYQGYSWFVVGLTALFCFIPQTSAWDIAVIGLAVVFTLASTDCLRKSELVLDAVMVCIPALVMLINRGTPLHWGLAALLVSILVLLTIWGAQQLMARRNEIALRMALEREKTRAEEANIAKSRFLAAASHDLRQPLHALSLFVEALKTHEHTPVVRELIQNIERSNEALDGLLNALLDISKLDAGTVRPEIKSFPIRHVLDQVDKEYRAQARTKGLVWTYEPVNAPVRTDPALLETIIRNLVGNAIRYTRRGTIAVRCQLAPQHIRLTISDTGIGIPKEKQQEVFHEFVQLHNPERDRTKGLGLGLSIVSRLTNLLDLRLEMTSESGVGTVFVLTIPLGETMALTTREKAENSPENPLRGRVVLIVDDEREIREGMRILLESWEALPVLADGEATAMEVLNELGTAPDAIIADFRLRDEMKGTEVIQRLRSQYAQDIPAAIVTGDTAPERIKEAASAGFLILHKPVKPAKLRSAIAYLLSNAR